jgi:PIN domain nuclease of toxin-antitoxin system
MRYLIDTHVFIWLDSDPTQLSIQAADLITDEANTLLLSHASIWEMQIKVQAGKLRFTPSLEAKVRTQTEQNRLTLLPIELPHIFSLDRLPSHHRDPFDRLLIAQAMNEQLPILSHDPVFRSYPVRVIW